MLGGFFATTNEAHRVDRQARERWKKGRAGKAGWGGGGGHAGKGGPKKKGEQCREAGKEAAGKKKFTTKSIRCRGNLYHPWGKKPKASKSKLTISNNFKVAG